MLESSEELLSKRSSKYCKFPLESIKMVRTKADGGGRKAVAAKAPRKQVGGGSSGSAGSMMSPSKNSGSCNGGNPIKWWPTPDWQKGVGDFFPKVDKKSSKASENTSSATSTSNTSNDADLPGISNKELEIEKPESDN